MRQECRSNSSAIVAEMSSALQARVGSSYLPGRKAARSRALSKALAIASLGIGAMLERKCPHRPPPNN